MEAGSDQDRYAGMTVNERLFDACLLKEFDVAAHNRDRNKLIALLMRVALSESGATSSVDAILANPSKYGY